MNLQFKRGAKAKLPTSAPNGMPLWCTDTKELYIGTENGVEKVGGSTENENTNPSGTDDLGNIISTTYEKVLKQVNTLSSSGTLCLADNSINKVILSGAVTFSLPNINDNKIFHQILVQLQMSSVYAIDFGTSHYFNQNTPDVSKAGNYNLIYEYDAINNYWTCGVVNKGSI